MVIILYIRHVINKHIFFEITNTEQTNKLKLDVQLCVL